MALFTRQAPQFEIPTDPAYYAWSIQAQLRAITLSLMLVVLIMLLARVYIRVFVLRVFRIDDYLIALATICSALSCCFFLHVIKLGMGKHLFAIEPQNILHLLKYVYITAVLIPLALCFVKLSVAFFLLSLTKGTQYGRFCWIIVAFLVVFTVFTFFTLILGCIPIAANWDITLRPPPIGTGNAKCLPLPAYRGIALANSITNIVTDIILAVMPIPLIWRLQVNKRTKASLIFILGLGFFACGAGIYKTPLLYRFFDNIDSTGHGSWYYAWQIIEVNTALLAATLPSLKPAFRWLLETARNIATSASGRGTRTSVMSPAGGAYKRQFSSGYLRQRDDMSNSHGTSNRSGTYNVTAIGPFTGKVDSAHAGVYQNDLELAPLPLYNVTIAANTGVSAHQHKGAVAEYEREMSPDRGRHVRNSSDAILRSEDGGLEALGPLAHGERGIFRTREITIVRA